MKVLMLPHADRIRGQENGIARVVEAYFKYLPQFDVEMVREDTETYDLKAVHAGIAGPDNDVCHAHGLYWTSDYQAQAWEWKANAKVVDAIRHAREVTVPSTWVAEPFQRDMHFTPHVVPHGIDWEDWQPGEPSEGYVLWNKNRNQDVCDPEAVGVLARAFPSVHFVTTFAPQAAPNIREIGIQPFLRMRKIVQASGVYLATTKETFGIGILEAMSSGVPVLGFAHGGILDLVQHGVNGYLAAPGNWEDLIAGLNYCLQHRGVLGGNGRELAKQYTWENACQLVAAVYREALITEPATATIVIPTYNYAHKVGRAIASACAQTYPHLRDIVVVDDGTEDDGETEAVVRGFMESDRRVRYVRQENQGVAVARNRGIGETSSKYVTCLDADDEIDPTFLEMCIPALENDRSLGIAYTRLRLRLDGRDGRIYEKTKWPGEFEYDQQLVGRNQVPTCCVFRREMWEQLGGFRQRYAPKGCGTEDANLWLRAGAAGWGAKLVTNERLFTYAFGTGGTTGDGDYQEVDWLAWHPWTVDAEQPFASVATPAFHSHPVRQYDQPIVSVVIPVGPGHDQQVINALDSLEAQSFRQWEVILAWDTDPEKAEWIKTAYPFVRFVDAGQQGAGAARNRGAEIARAPLLFFLDADDWLYPSALSELLKAYSDSEGNVAVYSDCVGLAYIDNPDQLAPDAQKRIVERRADGWTVIYQPMLDYDCETVKEQPDLKRPYVWNLISTLFPREWHDEIGGFDESMASWEDWDYWLRMAWAGKCFIRVPKDLLVYQFYSGQRREIGLQNAQSLVQYMQDKLRRLPMAGCSHCGQPRAGNMPPRAPSQHTQQALAVNDDVFVMAKYLSANKGDHGVVGVAQFTERIQGVKMRPKNVAGQTIWIIDYGYRSGGDTFLVHRRDLQLSPTQFEAVQGETSKVALPQAPPPVRATPVTPRPLRELIGQGVENVPAPRAPESTPLVPGLDIAPPTAIGQSEEIDPIELALQQAQTLGAAQRAQSAPSEEQAPIVHQAPPKSDVPDLQAIPGVSASIAEQMEQLGLRTPQDIAAFVQANGTQALMQINGVGERKAESIAAFVLARDKFVPQKVTGIPPELKGIVLPEE